MTRLTQFFGVGDPWVRPLPKDWLRADLAIALTFTIGAFLGLELSRSMGMLERYGGPIWAEYLALSVAGGLLVFRRRYPITSMVLMAATMFVTGVTMTGVMATFIAQITYLFGFYSVVAWGHPRGRMLAAVGLMVTFMFGWVAWQFLALDIPKRPAQGLFGYLAANIVYSVLVNVIFFGGAILVGVISWRENRQRSAFEAQARTIDDQARALREQAVVAERLRIARELHDVVAHHVSVIGVQAGAARRVFDKRPDAARTALAGIEESSRSAVTEMRALLGTLRADGDESRAPAPGFADLDRLVEEYRSAGLDVDFRVVDADPPLAGELPPGIGLSLYRTAQEALANVRRHSTARSAQVIARLDRRDGKPYAEIEVLDAGLAVPGSGGTGLGLTGMRERVAAHGGEAEIGPRATAGYRVRVRLPFVVG
ncbi:sensor histidine kinase [Flexivirga meconopsidis]|uniref:sensor histidine kinase n=1 Tax=Flexivirga meconopsidis TaxID=2977121 RepID=UPI0022400263|nr:histidine kinase [Flexivirga meconopsidis]